MKLVFYFGITVLFIILQTVILPVTSFFEYCFDFQIINVLYLSLRFSHYGVVLSIILIGCIMDSLSGTPFFYYIFSYLWVWALVRGMRQFVFSRSVSFIVVISLVSVLIQQILLVFTVFVQTGGMDTHELNIQTMIRQLLAGVIIIPLGIWVVNQIFILYQTISKNWKSKFETKFNH